MKRRFRVRGNRHIHRIPIVFMVLALMASPVFSQQVIYVDDDAPGGSGQSWQTAYKYLQDALAVAEADAEVRVAQGTYRPDRDSANPNGTGDRKATFELLSGMILKGGYGGLGNVDPNAWDVSLYETVLSGDLAGNDVLVNDPCDLLNEPTRSENSANIIMIRHASGISLEGLTIRGGFANIGQRGAVPQTVQGGGAYIFDCTNLAIDQCRFINNYAAFDGGGVLIDLCENVQVNDCLFLKNASSSGGGLLIGRSKGRIFRSRIEGNYASQSGGGICRKL